jgi:hypothetical protein
LFFFKNMNLTLKKIEAKFHALEAVNDKNKSLIRYNKLRRTTRCLL